MASVIIVGGGMAGIKTAIDLYYGGIRDILILEARDRLGGRVLSKQALNGSVTYDVGAGWFHDALKNPLFEKSRKRGDINYYFDDGKTHFFSEEDKQISIWDLEPVVDEILAYILLKYDEDPGLADQSLRTWAERYVQEKEALLTPLQKKYAAAVVRMWGELWHGESWESLSGKYSSSGGHHLGRNVLITSGYGTVLQNELDELPKHFIHNNVKLLTNVSAIDYTGDRIKVSAKGHDYYSDYVVVTVPRNLLQITDKSDPGHIAWTPQLPPKFQEILPSLNFGSLGKVILEFDSCFWSNEVDRFFSVPPKTPAKGATPKAWDYPALLVNYQRASNTPTLVSLTQRPLSEYLESVPESKKFDTIWNIFKPIMEQIAIGPVKKPVNIIHTPWNTDPWSRGAYGANIVGTADPNRIHTAFSDGLSERVRFAGAETMNNSSSGCVHGAWYSGQREAKHILDHAAKNGVSGAKL